MPARARRLVALTSAATAATALLLGAVPAEAATATNTGLFGSQDPTYDGVYRQSLSIVALVATGHTPDAAAVNWLLAQQCADGAFTAYRADPSAACAPSAEDENATAMAIQALVALGKPTATAVTALKKFQLADGGFYDNTAFGAPASDANSTGLALSALAASGTNPVSVKATSGKGGDDFLRSVQLPCSAAAGAGAYDFQPEATLHANDYATVQALLGELGKSLPVVAVTPAAAVPACPASIGDAATSAAAAESYLAGRLTSTNGAIPSPLGGGTDWTSTANAVIDLTAAGVGAPAVSAGLAALQSHAKTYAVSGGADAAGPLATMLLTAHATGSSTSNFGGLDLASALASIERTAAAPTPSASVSPSASPTVGASAAPTGTTGGGPTLPMTGAHDALPLSAVGAALLGLGAFALTVGRRRGRATRGE